MKTFIRHAGGLALILAFACSALFAQIKSGTIMGKVTDPSGAVVPEAKVTVVSQETNVAAATVTDQTGSFTVPYLAPGTYSVLVEKAGSGFAKFSASDLAVATAQSVRIDVVLKIGAADTVETVSASAIALQTTNATVQSSIDEKIIEAIPNITHNAFTYASLQAGVVGRGLFMDTTNTQSFGIGMDGRRQATAIQVNGGSTFSNDIMLDGVSIQGSAWNESAVLPNQDSLQEVKTITNNYSAEYGRAQGVVIFTTKSGTKDFHGTAGYRIRNEALNANSYNNITNGFTRPPFKSHTFNGSLGGPIIKNKAFFFVSYEGLRFHRGYDYLYTVPTAAERAGDFSNTMVKIGSTFQPVKIFNPYSAAIIGTNRYYTRTQYASNDLRTIPGALDPYGLALLQAYPLPNRTPDDATNQNNYFLRSNQSFAKNVINSRADYHFGEKHYLYTTFGLQTGHILTPRSWGPDIQWHSYREFVGNQQLDNNYYGALGDTFVLSNTLVVDARLGMNRIQADNLVDAFPNFDYSKYGIPQYILDINVIPGAFPQFNPGVTQTGIGGVTALGYGTSLHKKERQTNTDLNGSVTWTRGRWTHKFGGTYRVLLSNYVDVDDSVQIQTSANYTRQTINADGSTTSLPSLPDNTYAGLGIASIAVGAGNLRVSGGYQLRLALAQKYFGLYSQNDWRVTDKLTANIGLRWDVQPGPTERYNRFSSIDLNGTEPLFGTRGAIMFPGTNGAPRNLWHTQWHNFGPRLGFAYQLRRDFVVRGGYGVTYIPSNTGFNDGPGFYAAAMFTPSVTGAPYGTSPAGVIIGPFYTPAINPLVQPIGANVNNPGIYGGARRFPINFRNAFVQQWNLFLEQKIGPNWIFSAGYLGSHGRNLQVDYVPINSPQLIDPSLLETWRASYLASGTNPGTAMVQNPWQPATGTLTMYGSTGTGGNLRNRTMTLIETLYPFPLEGDNIHLTCGVSDYNALQLQATRQFAKGLQLNANYTWSKQFGASRYNAETNQNYGDGNNVGAAYWPNLTPERRHLNRQLTTNDIPQRLSINGLYQLPFGRGTALDTHNGILNAIVGGWSLSGSTIIQSGFIAPLTGGVTNSLNGLPDRVPGVPLEVPKELQKWYDGKTSVTLPSGRIITPCKNCFLKYNIDAFAGRTVVQSGGARAGDTIADLYWYGNAVSSYGLVRSPRTWFTNMAVAKNIKFGEKYALDVSAQATNVFNHTNFRPGLNMNMGGTVVTSNLAANASKHVTFGQILDVAANTFGTYTKNAYDPRQIEMSLHFKF